MRRLPLIAVALLACSETPVSTDPCEGETCSGNGRCVDVGEETACICDPGFVERGILQCVAVGDDDGAGGDGSSAGDAAPGGDPTGGDPSRGDDERGDPAAGDENPGDPLSGDPPGDPGCVNQWSLVESYNVGGTNFHARGVAVGPNGEVTVVGDGFSPSRWLVRRSLDAGATWDEIDDFRHHPSYPSSARGVVDLGTEILVTGIANNSTTASRWFTRSSTDGGIIWSDVDSHTATGSAWATTVAAAPTFALVAGQREVALGPLFSARGRPFAIGPFEVVDEFDLGGGSGAVRGVTIGASTNYLVGSARDASGIDHWLVRQGDYPTTTNWSTIDDVVIGANHSSAYAAVEFGTALIVVGCLKTTADCDWSVRRRADATASWVDVDTYSEGASVGATAIDAVVVGNEILVAGYADAPSAFIVVRSSLDGGITWVEDDFWALNPGTTSVATGIAADAAGNVYVSGYGSDSLGDLRWIVRKRSCQ